MMLYYIMVLDASDETRGKFVVIATRIIRATG